MIYSKCGLLILLLAIASLVGTIRALAVETKNEGDTDYLSDDYDYDAEYDLNKSEPDETEQPVNVQSKPVYFEYPEVVIEANPGDDVLINCDVRNFQITNVVVWYKDTTVIGNGHVALNKNVEALKNNSLIVKNVNMEDAGDYYCEVLPENVRMHATLKIGASLAIYCDGRDVTDRVLTFREGESHTFECKTYKLQESEIKWSLNGQRVNHATTQIEDGKLIIDNISEEHVGVYQCLADDGSKEPPHGMVSVEVQYKPKSWTHRHYVNAQTGSTAELYCDYKANPIAIINWLKKGQKLRLSDKYYIKNTAYANHNRTVLMIKDITLNDITEYDCEVENTIGANETKIHLIYTPETPQFEAMETDGNKVTLHWLVRSLQPLSEAMLDYKMLGSYTWSTVSVIHTHRRPESSGTWKITHEMELKPGVWHTRVKTKNTVGWSKFSPEHDFVIKDEQEENKDTDEEEEEVKNGTPPGDLVMAGIGIGASGTIAYIPAITTIIGSLCLLRLVVSS